MKRIIILFTAFIGFTSICSAANNPDDIIGIWLSSNGQGQIQIYKEGDKFFGKLHWMKEPNGPKGNPKLDVNNPDPKLKNQPLLGAVIVKNLKYDDGEWSGGKVYDPQNGKEYKCFMKLKDVNTLSLRGYIGFSLLGRTEVWTRVKS